MTCRRARLPTRRLCTIEGLTWQGQRWHVTTGRDEAGTVKEVFAAPPKVGSDIAGMVNDGCILASILMQHGVPADVILSSLGRDEAGKPTSIIGAIVGMAAGVD